MSYRGFRGISVDSFDGYDSTPYSGGYDLSLTYGRPLQPSDEICYPVSLPGDVDLERIHHSYGSQPSAFETENAKNSDCYGLLRPGFQFQPQPVSNAGYPDYGHQSYGHGGGGVSSGYGSVYCGRPQHQFRAELGESERKPQYESGYGREGSRQHQFIAESGESERKPQYESGYGREGSRQHQFIAESGESERKPHYESGYGREGSRQHQFIAESGESERKPQYGSGYGREGSRYDGRPQHQGLETEFWTEEAGVKPPQYGFGGQNQSIGYRKPSYYEGEGYGHSIYGNDSEHVEKKHSHHHRHY